MDGRAAGVIGGCPLEKNRPGFTWGTSSFGSLGSLAGAGSTSAAAMSMTPYPVFGSKGCDPTGCALSRRSAATWLALRLGRTVQIHAAAALTSGAAKLVPARPVDTPVESCESGTSALMSVPGAARSTQSPELENGVGAFCSSVAPTARTCAYEAGYVGGSPSRPLLPAAATMRQPARTAWRIALCTSGFGSVPPKLRLITAGHCFAAVTMPCAAEPASIPSSPRPASQSSSTACGYTPAKPPASGAAASEATAVAW